MLSRRCRQGLLLAGSEVDQPDGPRHPIGHDVAARADVSDRTSVGPQLRIRCHLQLKQVSRVEQRRSMWRLGNRRRRRRNHKHQASTKSTHVAIPAFDPCVAQWGRARNPGALARIPKTDGLKNGRSILAHLSGLLTGCLRPGLASRMLLTSAFHPLRTLALSAFERSQTFAHHLLAGPDAQGPLSRQLES